MKKVILVKHNDAQLSNQLWVHISVYAYCLERGYKFETYKFYEYAEDFDVTSDNDFINLIFYKGFPIIKKILKPLNIFKKRMNFYIARKLFKALYLIYYSILELMYQKNFIYAGYIPHSLNDIYFLPPTKPSEFKLLKLENDHKVKTIFFSGWLFRNPVGIKKYRKEILEYFKPKKAYLQRINEILKELKLKYNHLVGVHLRQKEDLFDGECNYNSQEMFYFSNKDYEIVKKCFNELLKFKNFSKEKTCFIICSNKPVEIETFSEFNIVYYPNNTAIEDLWLLAQTEIIMGCQSSFSVLASYLGDIPLIIFSPKIDWDYYKDKNGYFPNKYFIQSFAF